MLFKVVIIDYYFWVSSVDEILKCNHFKWKLLHEQYYTVSGTVYYVVQGGSMNVWVCGWNPKLSVTIQLKATDQFFPVVLFLLRFERWFYKRLSLRMKSKSWCDYSNESYWALIFSWQWYNDAVI